MTKPKIILTILVLLYLGAGIAYSIRVSYCEEQRLLANTALTPSAKENEGSNLIGKSITALLWPVFITGDKTNHIGIFACASSNTEPLPKPTPTSTQTQTFENSKLKIEVPSGWTARATTANPAKVNITKDNYILYINANASQASGVEGGRFAEIGMGSPSVDAVVTMQPSEPCGTSDKTLLFDIYSRVDLYVDASEKKDYCKAPTNNSNVWYFSYLTTSTEGYFIHDWGSDPSNLVVTLSYNSKIVNEFPTKGSTNLNSVFSDVTEMLKTLQLK